ncbi:MAG: metabolism ATPase/kinaselike protein [Bacteroidetes bacterium]|jgi:NadR type nicotinamide-nucleotide adenylyltransferase|nr:metabolism ATPase/kinaselike protein [Bacteroidota bacterium]
MEKKNKIKRIALLGPESTAKSTLAEQLANHYNTVWVKEYSREYLAQLNRKYTINDVLTIAKEQLENENKLIKNANQLIFADTELIISKVWCEDVFNSCPDWIKENLIPNKYDLYLLTFPDLEWISDPVRENPHRRTFFFEWYERELVAIKARYEIIKGTGADRLNNCITNVENFLADTKK